MEITDIRLKKIDSTGKMKAVCSITINDDFVVHDIKVIENQNGYFIAMPSKKTPEGEFKDIAHPMNKETRKKIHDLILEKFYAIESEDK